METHYLNSTASINSYRNFTNNAQIAYSLLPNSKFEVVEENLGLNCSFHKINYSGSFSYLESKYILPLLNTKPSAPFQCTIGIENLNYLEPNWYNLSEEQPYFDDKTKEYCITITAPISKIGDRLTLIQEAKNKAIINLFNYYNKDYTNEQLEIYNQYFIFAEVKDIYVPFRPLAKTKLLVAIKQKYFDAVPAKQQASSELEINIDKADYIITISLSEFEDILSNISSLLKLYNLDMFLSNTKIGFSFGTKGIVNTSETIIDELSLSEKADKVDDFYNLTINLLTQNNISFLQADEAPNKRYLQFAINDKCNIIYDVAISTNNGCIKPRVGINTYLNKDPINDPTIVNFIKNYKTILKIEKCKVSWASFVETYVYPEVVVKNLSINDIIQNYEKSKFEYARDFLKIFSSINEQGSTNPIKTASDLVKEEAKLAFFQSKQAFELSKQSLLARTTYVGDNSFNPDALEKSLKELYFINDVYSDEKETTTLKDKEDAAAKKAEDFWLVKLYEKLNKTGICKIIDFTMGCLMNNINDFIDINLEATLNIGSMNSLNSEELLEEVIPALPKEQQQLVYKNLLLQTSCINQKALLYYLKTTLPQESYNSLNLEGATYENVVDVTAELMATSI